MSEGFQMKTDKVPFRRLDEIIPSLKEWELEAIDEAVDIFSSRIRTMLIKACDEALGYALENDSCSYFNFMHKTPEKGIDPLTLTLYIGLGDGDNGPTYDINIRRYIEDHIQEYSESPHRFSNNKKAEQNMSVFSNELLSLGERLRDAVKSNMEKPAFVKPSNGVV